MSIDMIEEFTSVPESSNIERSEQAFELRVPQVRAQRAEPRPEHPANGDEDTYLETFANFSKGLPHNDIGEVELSAYHAMALAIKRLPSRSPTHTLRSGVGG